MSEKMTGRKVKKGEAEGEVIFSDEAFGFFANVEPETGNIIQEGHPFKGKNLKGKIMVYPTGAGSTVGSYTMYWLMKEGNAPAAIINKESEPITAVGAIISDIPMVDLIDISQLKEGDKVRVIIDNEKGEVEKIE